MAPASWKARLRPLVHRLRFERERWRERLDPPRPWDGIHHPVFERFPPWSGTSDGAHQHDFLGVKTDVAFRPQYRADPAGPVRPGLPVPSAGYLEWIALLQSAVDARTGRPYVVIELGAGHGAWIVPAWHAMRHLDPDREIRLVGVEMDPQHVAWMRRHLERNGVPARDARVVQAALSDDDGLVTFRPEPDAALRYGQAIARRPGNAARAARAGEVAVPCRRLGPLLAEHEVVDLLHVDIQGEEVRVLGDALDEVRRRVRRLAVATHGPRRHRSVRRLLTATEWILERDHPGGGRRRTEFGDQRFVDGLIVARRRR